MKYGGCDIDKNIEESFKIIDKYNNDGKNLIKLMEEIIHFVRNILIKKNVKIENIDESNNDLYEQIMKKTTNDYLFDLIKKLNESLNDMKNYNNPKIVVELLFIKLLKNETHSFKSDNVYNKENSEILTEKETVVEEFKEKVAKIKAEDDVEIADQEQLLYYQHFRKVFGKPKDVFPQTSGAIQCPKCKSWQVTKIQFCKKCGAYPI